MPLLTSSITTLHITSFIILSICAQTLLSDCPRHCECKWKSGKESVVCLNSNITAVPLHLDRGTQILDLTGNNLVVVKHDEFSHAGLLNLQKIYVSKCRIRSLEQFAFRHLINLVELDLSYNALSSVPSQSFGSVPELRELRLSGNPIQRIVSDAFVDLPQLVRLELSECRISTVESAAFRGPEKSLEWLKLDKNKLAELDALSFVALQSLHELELAGNPWNCSCDLRPLREWMLLQNVPFGIPPVCYHPKRLAAKSWDKLDLDEFACVPEILAPESKAHGVEGKNVTMTCRVAGIPEPSVRWMLKNKVIANLTGHPNSNKKLYVVHLENNASDLTILTADVQDAGVYVCAAENKAGRAEASVTLAVSRKPPESAISSRVVVVSVIAGTLVALASCLAVLCVCSVRKNRARWRNSNCSREDNYEKIEMNHKVVNINGGAVQNEISVVGNVRRHGEYRVVPGADTDQDEEEESNAETTATGPKLSNPKQASNGYGDGYSLEKRWNSPEHLLDPEDLHIPRRTLKEARDDFNKTSSSTSGTFNSKHPARSPSGATAPSSASGTSIHTPPFTSELSSLVEDDPERKYPDLIENFSYKSSGPLRTTKASSEGGSVTDITDLFCTLPRKRTLINNARYKSTDSQSPLLPESRYGSSGGDSSCSSSSRRLSDSQRHLPTLGKSRVNNISGSYLNLTSNKTNLACSSVREIQNPSSTPLLDVNSLENRIRYRPEVVLNSPPSTTNINTYDYHAAQLERFLEEYRSLQKQLTKMKESCETMRHEKVPVDSLMQHSLPVTPSTEECGTSKAPKKSAVLNSSSPLFNQTLDNVLSLHGYDGDLTRYFLTKGSSPTSINNGLFKN